VPATPGPPLETVTEEVPEPMPDRWERRKANLERMLSIELVTAEEPSEETSLKRQLASDFLNYHRTVFLEIVRARYWKDIDSGRLPRNSLSARFLLHSIDVGLDNIAAATELKDWDWIEKNLYRQPWFLWLLAYVGSWLNSATIAEYLVYFEARWKKRVVYVLTSFIDAHVHAQSKLAEYAGVAISDDAEASPKSREQDRVREESMSAVGREVFYVP
jgi:hypothetical protein